MQLLGKQLWGSYHSTGLLLDTKRRTRRKLSSSSIWSLFGSIRYEVKGETTREEQVVNMGWLEEGFQPPITVHLCTAGKRSTPPPLRLTLGC